MTRKQILNRELKVGDFVQVCAGGNKKSKENIWFVTDVEYGASLVKLMLFDGTYIIPGGDGTEYGYGFRRSIRMKPLQKIDIDVVVKRKES